MISHWIAAERSESRLQWLSAVLVAGISAVAEATALYVDHARGASPGLLTSWRMVHIGINVVILLLLFLLAKRSGPRLTVTAFFLVILPTFGSFYLFYLQNLGLLAPNLVFISFKLMFLVLSVLVPGPYWFNVALMFAFAIESAALWWIADPAQKAQLTQVGEPAVTILFAAIAGALLAFRFHYQKMSHELGVAEARAEVFEELSLIFLSIRDLANSPLQSLLIASELLKKNRVPPEPLLSRLDGSLNRLRSLSRIFKIYEKDIFPTRRELMSESEILESLRQLEKALNP